MKFAALVAAAAASPTQFVVDNWWNEAQNVFNFAQTNWQQFAAAADNVSFTFFTTPVTTPGTTPSDTTPSDIKIIVLSGPRQLLATTLELLQRRR